MSTRFFGPALRAAAAEAKAVLLALASEQLKTPPDALRVEDGVVFLASDRTTRVTFGQLAKGQKIVRKLDGKAVTKSVSEFRVMGRPEKRRDARAKVTGKAQYAGDIRLPGMLYAKVLRPPAHGATLKSVDTSAAARLPGVVVVNEGGMVAVLAPDPEAAEKALALVKAEFDVPEPAFDDKTVFAHLLSVAGEGEEREKKGDLAEGEKKSVSLFEGKYLNGYGAHAPIETHTALARLEDGTMTVWVVHADPVSEPAGDRAGDRVREGERPRHHPLRRRRLRRQERRRPPGDRGGEAREADRQAGPGVLEPRRGVLPRLVPAGGGRQDPVGNRRRGQDLPLGLPGLRGRIAKRRAVLRRPEQPDPDVRAMGQRHPEDAPVRHRSVARAGRQHQRLRAGIADRHDGGEGQGRSARVPPEQHLRQENARRPRGRGRAIRLEEGRGAQRPRRRGGLRNRRRDVRGPDGRGEGRRRHREASRSRESSAPRTWAS